MTNFSEIFAWRRALSLCVGLALLLTGCQGKQKKAAEPPVVETAVASVGAIFPTEQLSGIIAPYENVAIQSTLVEPADTVNVQEGDIVSAGEVLAQLDTADLNAQLQSDVATQQSNHATTVHDVYQGSLNISEGNDALLTARAAVNQAQANLARDTRDLQRYQALLENGYVSQQQVQDQEATVKVDAAALRTAQSQLAAAQSTVAANGTNLNAGGLQQSTIQQSQATEAVAAAQADQVRVSISKATIVSPIGGVVVNRNLNPGEYPGSRQLFTIQQVDPIYVVLHGSGAQIAQIRPGASATVSSNDVRGMTGTGHVVGILNEIVPGSTDFQVKVLMQNPGRRWRPGMVVSGQIALPAVDGVRIPSTAFTDDNHDKVEVVQSDSTLKTVSVVELASDGKTSVVHGIEAGTRVVSDGQSAVGDGEKISLQ
jgi:multidrug efflux pump subunit AcrA (membrane-fusion protein)